ncbi:MAG TPA: MFS transporter [Chloroflexota bacterium]
MDLRRRALLLAGGLHVSVDALAALINPLLPFIAADLGLSYAEVGLVKATFQAAGAALQWPVALLAERFGEAALLLAGAAWSGLGVVAMGLAAGFPALLAAALVSGLGQNAQHPLGSSLVARVYRSGGRATALGTLNFAGDVGKLLGAGMAGLLATGLGWRGALVLVGCLGVAAAVALRPFARILDGGVAATGGTASGATASRGRPWAFLLLLLVSLLDGAPRVGALMFLPFLLQAKGLDPPAIGLTFALVYAGGALGKFVCGWLGDRIGTLPLVWSTEVLSVATLVLLLPASSWLAVALALLFGFALNGTTSPLFTAVARLHPPEQQARAYGVYWTVVQGGAALVPVVYGFLADRTSLAVAILALAGTGAAVLPLSLGLRKPLVGRA